MNNEKNVYEKYEELRAKQWISNNALKVEKSIVWHQGSQHCYVPTKPNQTWTVKSK